MPSTPDLVAFVQKLDDLGLDPDQITPALEFLSEAQQAGVDFPAIAEAYRESKAAPPAPTITAPEDTAAFWKYLNYGTEGDNPAIPDPAAPLLAVMAANDAQDFAAAVVALIDLYRSERNQRPAIAAVHAAIEAAKPKPEPLPIEPAPEPVQEVKP